MQSGGSVQCNLPTDLRMREKLLEQAEKIAQNIQPDMARLLTFRSEDKNQAIFQRIKKQMVAYGQFMGLKSIYSFTLREGSFYFGPENIDEKSPLASPPGTLYEKPNEKFFEIFKTSRSTTLGPFTDEYGTFISAFAPVIDPRNNKVLFVIGLDVSFEQWKRYLWEAQFLVLKIVLIHVFIVFLFFSLLIWGKREKKGQSYLL